MAVHRSSRAHGLRLVSAGESADGRSIEHRPVVLHAVGTPRERLLLSPVMAALQRLDRVEQLLLGADPADGEGVLDGIVGLAAADRRLGIEDGTAGEQFAAMLAGFELALEVEQPELVVVAGASDAALACALAAAKRGVALAHVEAGLRSAAPRAPEFNRILTDRLADSLLAPAPPDATNLLVEGIPDSRVHVVGDTAIDVLRRIAPAAESCRGWEAYDLPAHGYVLVDVVDDAHLAAGPLLDALQRLAEHAPVALRLHGDLPVAPATLAARGITGCAAVRHLDRLSLLAGAGAVITNLGTIQDEASALGVACFTIGDDTDRPFTVSAGTNVLLGADLAALASVRPTGQPPVRNVVAPWDGRAAERVAQTLVAHYVLAGERPSVAQS